MSINILTLFVARHEGYPSRSIYHQSISFLGIIPNWSNSGVEKSG